MELGLKDKVALVLGGGGGLGSAIATTLAAEGAKIAVADHSHDALKKVAANLDTTAAEYLSLDWDLGDLSRIDPNIEAIESELGSVDVLVNITGGPPPTPVSGQDGQLWSDQFRSMVLSVIAITDRILPTMREQGWGRVITSTSSGVLEPIPNLGLSNALRSSLVGWSKTLAREIGRDGVTANIVVPGRIGTDRINFLDRAKAEREGRTVDEVARASTDSIPLGRYGNPQEYADTIAFLASTRASYITGSIIRVDGGMLASI
ncbi:SDR family oxidoreductase [Nocardia jiangxiensis]|uniref:3-oxoacyl-[acyl-carrier-protein] reductase MabA n=1 Tax=Nocardia jiangxiensis TaxID=282685 RepID=A0ABW6SHV6_9NOCA|nr:SDR family oxidoreductase [Nocardia jiangxiensis]